jgi:hypothetical protein
MASGKATGSIRNYVLLSLAIVATAALVELWMGRVPSCRCGSIRPWIGDAWGPENSQHLADPYSFTHVTHGILLYALLWLVAPRAPLATRAVIMVALEAGWEVLENTSMVIERYRATTVSLGYYGDSVVNSIGDILFCVLGFQLAARLPTLATAALAVGMESFLLLWIRDSLLLNILMLLYPIEAVKRWQSGG